MDDILENETYNEIYYYVLLHLIGYLDDLGYKVVIQF